MDMVKNVFKLRTMSLALAIALMGLASAASAGDGGCVSCHVDALALNALLPERTENHPDIGVMVNTLPTDCAMCHAAGSPMALMEVIHSRHMGIACDSCHEVDAETGVPSSVKTSPKNW